MSTPNPKTLATRIRPYFHRRRLLDTSLLGLLSKQRIYLVIPEENFEQVIADALLQMGLDESARGETYPIRYPARSQTRQVQVSTTYNADVVEALSVMGFRRGEILPVVSGLGGNTETQIQEALRRLAK